MQTAMKMAIQIINRIKGGHNALTHRKFRAFLEELETEYGDLLLYTEVRWLSRGKSLSRLFDLRAEVLQFLKDNRPAENSTFVSVMEDKAFLLELAFLSDISDILNTLNLQLQGRDKYIFNTVVTVNHFKIKLTFLAKQLRTNVFTSLPKTQTIYTEHPLPEKIEQFQNIIQDLLQNFSSRFQDFQCINNIIDLHNNTIACNIQSQNQYIAKEVEKMHSDFTLSYSTGVEFWKTLNAETYPHSKKEVLKLYSMFPSTYNCESAFSCMTNIMTKHRNHITNKHLEDLMRMKCYTGGLDIEKIIKFCKKKYYR